MSKLLLNVCKNENLSPNDIMILFALVYKIKGIPFSKEELEISKNKLNEFLLIKDSLITNKGKRLISDYTSAINILEGKGKLTNKKVDRAVIEAEIVDFVEKYRKLFQGTKIGAMGDKKGCIDKFITFYQEYPEYANAEIILRATKLYINSVNDYRYLKQADYFIYKHDLNKNKVSTLATYCAEIDLNKPEKRRSFTEVL